MAAASYGSPQNGRREVEGPAPRYVEGVVLLDIDLRIVGFDEGAAAILQDNLQAKTELNGPLQVPPQIFEALRTQQQANLLSRRFHVHLGRNAYLCRIHVARSSLQGLPHTVTVLHLARDLSMDDALMQIGTEYRLTVREQQALRGVLLGLSSKEVAEQMKISPNTVKAFLRLIMGKMGVSSRTGIVAKLFEPNGHG